jgi:hypothetical protein
MKAIKISKTKGGDKLVLAACNSVWIQKTNYSLGKLRKSWCLVVRTSTLEEAEKVFKRRSA